MKKARHAFLAAIAVWLCSAPANLLAQTPVVADGRLPGFERQAMGQWRTAGTRIVQLDPVGTKILLSTGAGKRRYSASVRVRLPGKELGEEGGLLLHFTSRDEYLAFSVTNRKAGAYGQLRIARKKPQTSFVADQTPISGQRSDWYELRAEVDGVEVHCYLDGKPLLAYSFEGTPPPYDSHGRTWDPDPNQGRVGLIAVNSTAEFENFRVGPRSESSAIVSPTKGRYDTNGRLLPRQSYSDTMRLFTDWFLHSEEVVDTSKAPKSLRHLPPYLLTNFLGTDDTLWGTGGEFAFCHSLVIAGAVHYFMHTGERKYLEIARKAADWQIEHSTPADWAWPYLAPSFVKFKEDGSWEGMEWGYEPDKSAYLGYALLRLHAASGERKYLDAALRIAATLSKHQQPDGNWPFRVNARSGESKQGYSCTQLWYVWFFERLAEATGDSSHLRHSDAAFRWVLNNPVRTNEWVGLYGDVASGARSFDQWVPLETAMYLIERRRENPEYVEMAKRILDWVNAILVVDYGFFPNVPGLVEQSEFQVVLTHHQLRLAEMYAKLWEVTRKAGYRDLAIEIANSVTWVMTSDGKIRQGFWQWSVAVPLILSFNHQFARVMAAIPETAPRDRSHLLETSGLFKDIRYGEDAIQYETAGASYDVLTVVAAPKSVSSGGQRLPRVQDAFIATEGWSYEPGARVLRIRHQAPGVVVALERGARKAK